MDQPAMQALLRDLQTRPENKKCVDCGTANPQWATVTYGTFMCLECSGRHRSLGTHLSFVRSVGMDKWKEWEVQRMKHGGNGKFVKFAKDNKIQALAIQEKYNSHPAAVYAAKLKSEATGEPYVAPPTTGSGPPPRPNNTKAPPPNSSSSTGWDSWGESKAPVPQTVTPRKSGGGVGGGIQMPPTSGQSQGYGSGGISSDMWNDQRGRGEGGMNHMSSSGGRAAQRDAFNMDKLSDGLSKGMSTIQSSELAGQATKAAAQAADSLKSWFGTVSATVVNVAAPPEEDVRGNLLRNLGPRTQTSQGSSFEGFSSDQWRQDHAPPSLSSDQYRAQQQARGGGRVEGTGKKMASLSSDDYRAQQASRPGAVGGGLSSDQYRAMQQSAGSSNPKAQQPAGYQQQSAKESGADGWGGFEGDSKGEDAWGWGSG